MPHIIRNNDDGSTDFVDSKSRVPIRFKDGYAQMRNFTFTPGAEGANGADAIDVVCQLVDMAGNAVAQRVVVWAYYSVDPQDYVPVSATAVTIVTGTTIRAIAANLLYVVATDANGVVTIRAAIPGASTKYLNLVLPDGRIVSSALLTWAA